MGLNFSSRRELYLRQTCNPTVTNKEETFIIRLEYNKALPHLRPVNGDNPFQELGLKLQADERVVIRGIYVRHIANEMKKEFTVEINNLFHIPEPRNQEANHVDHTGKIRIVCSPLQNAPTRREEAFLYKPQLADATIEKYAGTEDSILNTQTFALQQGTEGPIEQVFPEDSPLLSFIWDHSTHGFRAEKISTEPPLYRIDEETLDRVRTLFKNGIFKDLRYTTFEGCRIFCPVGEGNLPITEGASLVIQLKVEYFVIKIQDNAASMKSTLIPLYTLSLGGLLRRWGLNVSTDSNFLICSSKTFLG